MVFDVVPAFEGTEKEAQAASELQRILFLLCCSVLRSASVILAFIVSYFYWLLVLEVFTLFHFILLMYYVLHLIYIGYCYIYALLHLYVYCLCCAAQSPRWLPSSRVQKWVCKTTRE